MISVIAPLERAFLWMKRVLFNPFDLEKWFVMGFCAFLAGLAGDGGGGGGSYHSPFGHEHRPDFGNVDQVSSWISAHLPLLIVLGAIVGVVILVFVLLCLWLGSRGQFMFLDGVVRNRAAVTEPWHRYRGLGNDLFIFRVQLSLCAIIVLAVLGVLGWMVARPDIAAGHFGGASAKALLVAGGPAILVVVALFIVSLVLNDFVVPIMYRRDIGTGQALGVLWREIIPGHGGAVILYFLMKVLLTIGAVLLIMATCCACCLAVVPYIGSVVTLPILVLFRAYSLYFLEQFGEEWRMVGNAEFQPQAQQA